MNPKKPKIKAVDKMWKDIISDKTKIAPNLKFLSKYLNNVLKYQEAQGKIFRAMLTSAGKAKRRASK